VLGVAANDLARDRGGVELAAGRGHGQRLFGQTLDSLTNEAAHDIDGQWGDARVDERRVERAGDVRKRVDDRAVEVKQKKLE
jgi:hypothetical protein